MRCRVLLPPCLAWPLAAETAWQAMIGSLAPPPVLVSAPVDVQQRVIPSKPADVGCGWALRGELGVVGELDRESSLL